MSHDLPIISAMAFLGVLGWALKMIYGNLKSQIADSQIPFRLQADQSETSFARIENKIEDLTRRKIDKEACQACGKRLDKLEADSDKLFDELFDLMRKYGEDLAGLRTEVKVGFEGMGVTIRNMDTKIEQICTGRRDNHVSV
ncbi:MAG: hypothetical protein HQK58_14185 [Deltaproteobacteria bacterium]|nr:hypothetical protein [Deltaproteobacteria bacterium]